MAAPGLPRSLPVYAVWLLVFASVVSWRRGVIFSGDVDPTVTAKAAVAILALVAAAVLRRTRTERRRLNPIPVFLVGAVVAIALIGSQAAGEVSTNIVLTVRIVLLTATVLLVLSVTSAVEAIAGMLAAMATVGLVAAGSGFYVMVTVAGARDRLQGALPPLEPNELATLVLPPALGAFALLVRRGVRPAPLAAMLVLVAIIYETGSRTALGMFAVGAVAAMLIAKRVPRALVAGSLLVVLGGYVVAGFTGVLQKLLLRGQDASQLSTLNSRTISWNVVLATPHDTWAWWIGNGLSEKTVAVLGQYWSQQVFDSSWISSLAQDGIIGTVLLGAYVAGTVLFSLRRRSLRPLLLAIAVTTVIRSFVENGLIESSTTYVLFLTVAVTAWSPEGWRRPPRAVQPAETPAAQPEVVAPAAARVLAYPAPMLRR